MSSPWNPIKKIQTNFADVMSEQYANVVQERELKKYGKQLHEKLSKEKDENHELKNGDNDGTTNYNDDNSENDEDCEKIKVVDNSFDEKIPEEILKMIQQDSKLLGSDGGAAFDEICDSDALIAHVLQQQYDREYNEDLKRLEKKTNRNAKVSISYDKYLRNPDEMSDDSDDDDDELYEHMHKKDWDRFETNEKLLDEIPKCGFKIDKEGEMITKHDPQLCGIRNACKVMDFPPDFPTGDGAGFDMKLSNKVYNQLKTYSQQKKKSHMDRKENIETSDMGVDGRTRLLLYKLINNQILEQVNGIISTGKEAIILHADSGSNYVGELILPKECAIKIFKTTLNEFKQRDRYIKDDYRFKERFGKQNKRVVINMWAEKEMHNLIRMQKCGINCPDVVTLKKHILVMSFIGDNHNAALKLKDAQLSYDEISLAYEELIEIMFKLYNEAKLIHADLSEYNILWYDGKCWIIDVAQSVEPKHPSALEFLIRDCNNIISFFTKRGLPNILTKEELFQKITGLNAEEHNTAMLERIHNRGASVKQSTAPNQEDCPDEVKPLSYPFDLAWEKSLQDKKKKLFTK